VSFSDFSKYYSPKHVCGIASYEHVRDRHYKKSYVIIASDTFVNPHAMMVKMFYTNITRRAMFGPCRFCYFTCSAFFTRSVHNVVISIFVQKLLCFFLIFDYTRFTYISVPKCHPSKCCSESTSVLVIFSDIWSRTILSNT